MVDLVASDRAPVDQHVAENEAARLAAARRNRLGPMFWIPLAWLLIVLVTALGAERIGLMDPDEIDFIELQTPPSQAHWLGTDVLGRDILSRIVHGARVSLTVGFFAPAVGLMIGLVLGVIAGYYRGIAEEVIVTGIDAWLSIPGLVILLIVSTVFGGSMVAICVGLGTLFSPAAARVTRAAVLANAQREYVLAARALGASDLRILALEIFPNIVWPILAWVFIAIPVAIVVEGALSFLGVSVPSPTPSWGGMIAEGREHLEETPHISLLPTLVMFLTVLSFNLVGDVARRRLADVRESAI